MGLKVWAAAVDGTNVNGGRADMEKDGTGTDKRG